MRTWESHALAEEEANMGACLECAKANGKTEEEADNCDFGDVGCPDCPFAEAIEDEYTRQWKENDCDE